MLAKRFFYVCAGLLCLTVAFHLGAVSAHGQAGIVIDGANESYNGGTICYCPTRTGCNRPTSARKCSNREHKPRTELDRDGGERRRL